MTLTFDLWPLTLRAKINGQAQNLSTLEQFDNMLCELRSRCCLTCICSCVSQSVCVSVYPSVCPRKSWNTTNRNWRNSIRISVMVSPRSDSILVIFELDLWPWQLYYCFSVPVVCWLCRLRCVMFFFTLLYANKRVHYYFDLTPVVWEILIDSLSYYTGWTNKTGPF